MNARHTTFDSVGFRGDYVTAPPVTRIPDRELGKPPRSERDSEGEDQAQSG